MNKSKSISNENYLVGKNLVAYSPINFEENIITDPSIPPNGFINKLNNDTIEKNVLNENVLNENVLNENVLNDNVLNENVLNENVLNENVLNDNVLNENVLNDNVLNDNVLNNEILNSNEVQGPIESDTNSYEDDEILDSNKVKGPSESDTYSYATELIDNAARAPHNRRDDMLKKEINKINNMNPGQRANLQIRNEIMQIFPLSIIIALIIFILLLIYVVGFRG